MPFEFFSALASLVAGLYLLSPFWQTTLSSGILVAINTAIGPIPFGLLLAVLGTVRLFSLLVWHGERSINWRRRCATISFIVYLFFTVLRILAYGASQTIWVAMGLIAITELLARLQLGPHEVWTH